VKSIKYVVNAEPYRRS